MQSENRVAALAGRRIDPPNSTSLRFPLSHVASVRTKIKETFLSEKIDLLVCAAASGADLIALEEASKLKIEYRIVLPLDPTEFRASSVTDRPGSWGPSYDGLVATARSSKNLIVVEKQLSNEDAYHYATQVILEEANAAAAPEKALAIIVWDGRSRGADDFSVLFRKLARKYGMREREILTR
jgi:hypothetical protein